MKDMVISLGGSMIVPKSINTNFIKQILQLVQAHAKKGYRVVLICGGGYTARHYQDAAKKSGKPKQADLDWVGIKATALNAELIRSLLPNAYEQVVTDPTAKITTKKKIIVGCGWKPGFSSDMDAVVIAENLNIPTIINLTNVQYVYDKDPKKYKDAKPQKELTWQQLQYIVGKKWVPGANVPFDPKATAYAKKTKPTLYIVKGTVQNVKQLFAGKEVKGTVVH